MRRKYNNQYANYSGFGDYIKKNVGNLKDIGLKAIQDESVLSSLGLAGNQLTSSAISGGLNSGVGSGISQVGNQVGSLVGKVNPLLGSMVQVGSGIVGGLTNRAFGYKINEENVESVNQNISELSNFTSNAADFDTLISNQQSAPVAYNFSNSFIGKDGWFSNKVKNKANALRNELMLADAFKDRSIINNVENIETERANDLFSNFKANGGQLNAVYNKSHINVPNLLQVQGKYKHPKRYDTGGYTGYSTPMGYLLGEENTAANIGWGIAEFIPYVNIATGIGDVANDVYNIYNTKSLNASDWVNLGLDVAGLIPGVNWFTKSGKLLKNIKTLKKTGEKIEHFGEALKLNTPKGIKETKKKVKEALDTTDDVADDYVALQQVYNRLNPAALQYYTIRNIGMTADAVNDMGNLTSHFNEQQKAQGGRIEIDPENRGKFNATKKRTGKTTEELTHSKNPLTRKRAIFAQNAAKWKHSDGGFIDVDPNFNMGIQYINEGSTHEQNPFGGIQIGVDNEGVPNLVEEGEVIYNNYVFSNRINMPNKVKNKYKLRKTKPITFAEGIKQLSKEYEEMPNDPISKRGLDALMTDLMIEQESLKQKKEERQYKKGGFLNVYEEGTPDLVIKPRKDLMQRRRSNEAEAKKAARLSNLRYAPIVQSGINAITDAFGLTNTPDYSASRAMLANLRNSGRVPEIRYTPLSNYMQYTPLDTRLQINDLNAAANASRRALTNSGGTPAQGMAAIIAADNAYIQNLGKAAVEVSEANLRRRQQVEDFNRATNQYNTQASLQAQQANAQLRAAEKERANATFNAAISAMAKERELSEATKAANLNNLYQNLGNLGIDELSWSRLRSMAPINNGYSWDRSGTLKYNNTEDQNNINKKGGCLTTKKKRK